MSGQFYDNALRETYVVNGADLTGAAAADLKIVGPKGKQGRVVNLTYVVTTGITVADSSITVGPNGAPTVTLTAPVASADATGQADTELDGQTLLAADTLVEIGNGGGATAGIVDVVCTIDWF